MKVKEIITKLMHCTQPKVEISVMRKIVCSATLNSIYAEDKILNEYGNRKVETITIKDNTIIINAH